MSFFDVKKQTQSLKGNINPNFLHKYECSVCPLNTQRQLKHPKMEPAGTDKPLVYFLGEAPGADEDRKGVPFVGKAGRVLKFRLPADMLDQIRWNNCIRTRPPDNRDPDPIEIECCRPSIVRDIETTKPKAIFGFGAVPLRWALQQSGITKWRGRRIPVTVGEHSCWYYPFFHPSYILRTRKFTPRTTNRYGSELEFAFALDLKRAFDEVANNLPKPIVHDEGSALAGIEYVTGENGWNDVNTITDFLEHAANQKLVGFDYETNCLRPYTADAKILTVALATKDKAFAFPLEHSGSEWAEDEYEAVQKKFHRFLYKAPCRKLSHNLTFEMEWSAYFYGKEVLRASKWGDSLSQAYILRPQLGKGKPGCYALEFLCLQYFGVNVKQLSGLDRAVLDDVDVADVLKYNGLDAKYHRLLYQAQASRLKADKMLGVYKEHMRRLPTVVLTQLKGVPVNQKTVDKYYNEYVDILNKIDDDLADLKAAKQFKRKTGKDYRPSATTDVKAVLATVGLFPDKADEEALSGIDEPIIQKTLEWRKANKIWSTYIKPVIAESEHIYPDGRMHPITSTTRVETWRTSSEDPNYQNWPKRDTTAKVIRKQIDPGPGYKIVSFDYGSIQARNVAMESKDTALVEAFWKRYDIHADWTRRIAEIYPRWVEGGIESLDKKGFRELRSLTKNQMVFPAFFGAQAKSIAGYLGVPERIAEIVKDDFYGMFPGVPKWHKRITAFYYKHGYVTGLSGFRRHAPISPNQLINAPIQADEAVIVLDAMTRLSEIDPDVFQASMEIHDDLSFIWPAADVDKNAEVVINEMLDAPFDWINVPIVVEMSVGDNWADMEDVGEYASDKWFDDDNANPNDETIIMHGVV